jgi:hypothetical protein
MSVCKNNMHVRLPIFKTYKKKAYLKMKTTNVDVDLKSG